MDDTRARQPATSYRASHLEKGAEYDAGIASSPFDAYLARVERELLPRIVRSFFPRTVPRYLDFACGTGRITSVVAPHAAVSFGVDVSASMVAGARARCPETEFILHDLTVGPLVLEPVDLVTAFRFLGNAEPELRRSALRALHGLLVPDGCLVVNNHRNAASIHNRLLGLRGRSDGSDLTLSALTALLRETGFDVVKVYGIGAWVIRYGLQRRRVLESSWADRLERLSRVPGIARLCPDMIVVARRVESANGPQQAP